MVDLDLVDLNNFGVQDNNTNVGLCENEIVNSGKCMERKGNKGKTGIDETPNTNTKESSYEKRNEMNKNKINKGTIVKQTT